MELKPEDNSDITEETAQQILIEELEKSGVWQKNMRVKIAVKILFAQILNQQTKIDTAISILQ